MDEVGFAQQSALALVCVVAAKLSVGAHFAALLVDFKQALGNGGKVFQLDVTGL